jgi:long-chain fatty acid transport protein
MYLVGYGAETVGRGGANLAISDRSLALNFNPAGIAQLQGNHYSLNLSVLAPSLEFENMINAPIDGESRYFPLPAFAYVRGSDESPWNWGIGFLAQGGMGATFENMNTFFGTRDETYSEVAFMTLTPTVAYSVSDDMAFGLTVNIGYAETSFRFFPNTSAFNPMSPEQSFFGIDMDGAAGLQTNLRLGWWYRPAPKWSVGLIYQTETDSDFEDGDMIVNFESHPFLGRRVHYDAEVDGFTFAAQAGVGFAYRPTSKWTLALDVKRYFWDSAIDTIKVTATNPEVAGAPPVIEIPFVFDWQDQWVFAFGGDYRVSDRWTVRAGYNYGENPVPDETLTPLFPATTEHHLAVGASVLAGSKTIELALERAFSSSQTNNNPNPMVNPFGPGARVDHEQWTFSFGISWAIARQGHGEPGGSAGS